MTLWPRSLRARLLWSLLAAILLTAVAQGSAAYRTARVEADQIFDYQMRQMALSLRPGLPRAALGPPAGDDGDDIAFVVRIWSADGLRVYQSTPLAALPERAVLGFSEVAAGGTTYRVFSLQTRSQIVQIAQDMAVRREMAGALALRTVAPIAVMAPVLMLLAWWVVGASLQPVARVRRQLAQRRADEFSEVGAGGLPDEIRPLVEEFNLLLGRVRRAFDAQRDFVADAAHELRSPLAALRLQVQGLQRAGDEAARELAVQRLTTGIDRATRLVEQLLVLARQQAGMEASAPRQRVQLAELARAAVADSAAQSQARRIDLGLTEAADEATVLGHPEALRILCRNLVDNALKYTPPGGRVDVAVACDSDGVRLSVDDSGPGIAESELARVLDRFYRVAGQAAPGSGLGLAIVKSIADLHAATLTLTRSAQLGGLRVTLRFPPAHAA